MARSGRLERRLNVCQVHHHMRNIRRGDMLTRRKALLVEHCGTAVGWYGGLLYVAHLMPGRGYVVDSYADFLGGGRLMSVTRPTNPEEVIARVRRDIERGSPYDLLMNNCQHGCTRAATGTATSWQLPALGFVAAVALIGVAVAVSK